MKYEDEVRNTKHPQGETIGDEMPSESEARKVKHCIGRRDFRCSTRKSRVAEEAVLQIRRLSNACSDAVMREKTKPYYCSTPRMVKDSLPLSSIAVSFTRTFCPTFKTSLTFAIRLSEI